MEERWVEKKIMKKYTGIPHIRSDAKFVDVADALRKEILAGRWAPGTKIPTWTDLCKRFSLGRPTLTRALDILKRERFIVADSTRGTLVSENPPTQHRYALLFPEAPGKAPAGDWSLFWESLIEEAKQGEFAGGNYIDPVWDVAPHSDNASWQRLQADISHRCLAGLLIPRSRDLLGIPSLPGTPAVFLGSSPEPDAHLQVEHDWRTFFNMAVDDLLAQDRRHIAILTSDLATQDLGISIAREKGADCPDEWGLVVPMYAMTHTVQLLFSRRVSPRPDALVMADSNLLEGTFEGLRAARISLPDDLRIVTHVHSAEVAEKHPGIHALGFPSRKTLETAIALAEEARATGLQNKRILLGPEYLS